MFFAPLPVLLESAISSICIPSPPLLRPVPNRNREFRRNCRFARGEGRGSGVIFTRPNYRTARNELAGGDMFHSGIVLHAELRPETITTIGLRFVKRRAANILLFRVKGKLHFDSFLKHDNWA